MRHEEQEIASCDDGIYVLLTLLRILMMHSKRGPVMRSRLAPGCHGCREAGNRSYELDGMAGLR